MDEDFLEEDEPRVNLSGGPDVVLSAVNVHIHADENDAEAVNLARTYIPKARQMAMIALAQMGPGVTLKGFKKRFADGTLISVATIADEYSESARLVATIYPPVEPPPKPEEEPKKFPTTAKAPFIWVGVRRVSGGEWIPTYTFSSYSSDWADPDDPPRCKPFITMWEPPFTQVHTTLKAQGKKGSDTENEVIALYDSMMRFDHMNWLYLGNIYQTWQGDPTLRDWFMPKGVNQINVYGHVHTRNGLYIVENDFQDFWKHLSGHDEPLYRATDPWYTADGWKFEPDQIPVRIQDPHISDEEDDTWRYWDTVAVLDPPISDISQYLIVPPEDGSEPDMEAVIQYSQTLGDFMAKDWEGKPQESDDREFYGRVLTPEDENEDRRYALRVVLWHYFDIVTETDPWMAGFEPMEIEVRVRSGRGEFHTVDDYTLTIENPCGKFNDCRHDAIPGGIHNGLAGLRPKALYYDWMQRVYYGQELDTTPTYQGATSYNGRWGNCRDRSCWTPTILIDPYGGSELRADVVPWGIVGEETQRYWPSLHYGQLSFWENRYPNPPKYALNRVSGAVYTGLTDFYDFWTAVGFSAELQKYQWGEDWIYITPDPPLIGEVMP